MDKLMEALSGAHKILNSNIAVVSKEGVWVFPENNSFDLSYEEAAARVGQRCKGYCIYKLDALGSAAYVCIQGDRQFEPETVSLVSLLISLASKAGNPLYESFSRLIDGKYDGAELIRLEEIYKDYLPG